MKNNAFEKVENISKGKVEREKEKQEKIAQKKMEKARIKAQKNDSKEKRKAEKLRYRIRKKEQNRNSNKKGGLIASIVALSIGVIVLSFIVGYKFLTPTEKETALELSYQRSFYDTIEQVDNIDLNLSKILKTNDNEALQKYLVDTAIFCEVLENDLQSLPLSDENRFFTAKLVNQIGDYCKYVNNKLIDGESLSNRDKTDLNNLYKANLEFKKSLGEMTKNMGTDFSFSNMKVGEDNLIVSGMDKLQNLSENFPELIYDGPFSDSANKRKVKGLTGDKVNEKQAKENFEKIFADVKLTEIEQSGETTGLIECYNFTAKINGEEIYAQISKIGGHLIMFDYAGSCEMVNFAREDADKSAKSFLENLKIYNMEPVWINLASNVYTINYAYTIDGITVYPDMVKVRVCAKTGRVLGLEAKEYYINHVDRKIESEKLTEVDAKGKVSSDLEILSTRKCIVPKGLESEKLAYEFACTDGTDTYFIYIDATTGKQIEMFKVVDGETGSLLM